MFRMITCGVVCWSLVSLVLASTPIDPKNYPAPVRVACVGDSITAGFGAGRGASYPDQLGAMLGDGWDVRNFGVSGRTLLRKGDYPYWKERAFIQAKEFKPDVVIILLGANDTKPHNWKHGEEFPKDYSDMLAEFRALPCKPRIYVGRPCPVPEPGNFGINEVTVQKEIAIIDRIAAEQGLDIIDFHAVLADKPQMLPDRVHPNAAGYEVMAATVSAALTGKAALIRTVPAAYFRSHAVLQRGIPVPVWGTGADGSSVSVSFAGQSVATIVTNHGWRVVLAPLQASASPACMMIAGTSTNVLEDVVVGDVWLASGQSNMERQLGPRNGQALIAGWQEAAAKADYPLIRQFYVNQAVDRVCSPDVVGHWTVCSPASAPDITAVGFFFARELQPAIGVPVGIIHSSKGGSRIEMWMSPEMRKACAPAVKVAPAHLDGATHYHAMIEPLRDVPITGVIWYQGESNSGNSGEYRTLFPAMITGWREVWRNPGMPFLFVQIAPHLKMPPEIREAQFLALEKVRNTAMAVLTDVGDARDIHPSRKAEVGHRLALAAKAIAYGAKDEYSGPLFRAARPEGTNMVVTFDHVTGGLAVQGGGELKGFTIAGVDGKFTPAAARITGETVLVTSGAVTNPAAVRYGWENVPNVNLVNGAGLPASPFRSDVPAIK